MELTQTYHYQGWNISYRVVSPSTSAATEPTKLKRVLFVHGTPWSSAVFRPIAEAVLARKTHQVLLYDLPGYGKSQDFTAPYHDGADEAAASPFRGDTSVKFQASALTALLGHVQWTSTTHDATAEHTTSPSTAPAVIAHDIAGAIVLRTHLLHSRLDFSSLLLLDTNASLPWGDGFYKLARANPEVFTALPPHIHEAVVRAVVRSACHRAIGKEWVDVLTSPWIAENGGHRSFVRQIAQANDGDVAEMLEAEGGALYGRVRCDVKVLWGERDSWIPRRRMEELVGWLGERCKGFVVVPDAGHLCMLDQPTEVREEVLEWLGRTEEELRGRNR